MELGAWLRALGLGQYETAFRENAVDETVLPSLTAEDLKDLGIALVGHRRKLLDAISALRPDASGRPAEAPWAADRSPGDAGERRQVTVMFSDLVGSTALSARMDPEDLREIISAYQTTVAESVHRHDGYVAKYMGDGVLIYFGYPQAHEDDAERAVRVGLELIAAVGRLERGIPLQTRVGIATGLVVVGDMIGTGEAQERGIVGETPNLAARLQAAAEPDTVVIADGTRRLLGDLFDLRDLGSRELKGIGRPVRAWAALRDRSMQSRFQALRGNSMANLVGRREELDLLLRDWAEAKGGDGRVVLLSGEPGIGKSRLTVALLDRLTAEPATSLHYFCSPQHTDSALYPVIRQLERAAGLEREDTPQARLDKLDALFATSPTSSRDVTLFAELLSLPNDGRYPALDLAPRQRRQRTLEALVGQIDALVAAGPVLMVFEDVHWIDPSTLEMLGRVVERAPALRLLLIVTFRPEFRPPWVGQAHVSTLRIDRLVQEDAAAVIDRVAGGKALPEVVRRDIIERTDGIPLFIEEMTKAVLEADADAGGLETAAAVPARASSVPATLHASLMARLDRLGPARELAQIGAAVGREFSRAVLAAVARKSEAELDRALDDLVAAGLLLQDGASPNPSYQFKHALVQDAAYGTLLREPRRALHARIAEVLESTLLDIAENRPELLARHCTEAGLVEKSAELWAKAGRRSLARSAMIEAAEQLARALGQIASVPGTAALRREEIRLQVDLANALIHTRGHAAPETQAAFDRARGLIEQAEVCGDALEDPLVLFSVLYGFWVANRMAFKGDIVCELAAQFLALSERQSATVPIMIGHLLSGISQVLTGDPTGGREHLDHAIALYDPAGHRPLATRFGHDVRVTALSWRAVALWVLGYPCAALTDVRCALDDADAMGHAATSMFALSHASVTLIECGELTVASALADDLVRLADEKGALYWKGYGILLRGRLLGLAGNAGDAVAMLASGIAAMRSTGATAYAPMYLSSLAKAYAELGLPGDALRCIDEALAAVEATGERWCEPEIHRLAGEVALMRAAPDCAMAEAHFERALEVARRQRAKSWELRAAIAAARIRHSQGRRHLAHELVDSVQTWFGEGHETLDLKAARMALAEFAP